MRYEDAAPFSIKAVSMSSLHGGGQSEWMFPRDAGDFLSLIPVPLKSKEKCGFPMMFKI